MIRWHAEDFLIILRLPQILMYVKVNGRLIVTAASKLKIINMIAAKVKELNWEDRCINSIFQSRPAVVCRSLA